MLVQAISDGGVCDRPYPFFLDLCFWIMFPQTNIFGLFFRFYIDKLL
jgi:hypothetical protein